mmetsp:Transcript_15611/g.35868  ORF Transcript_15611/g.35868 Transcript_15611/m.35868 type:complete len:497 (+) Transcript_15611:71-1561(+)
MVPAPRLTEIATALHANISSWASEPWVQELRHRTDSSLSLLLDGPPGGSKESIYEDIFGKAPVEKEYDGHKHGRPDYDDVAWGSDMYGSWLLFFACFASLLAIDHLVLHRQHKVLSFQRASLYVVFWICCAAMFNVYVWVMFGPAAAFNWGSGYILEWMLSMDNLFVFHMVFNIYGTPDHLKHKPLFYGIVGAIAFRLLFFVIGEWLFHVSHWMHLFFGAFLVYTGIKAGLIDEEDEDPTQHPVVKWMSMKLPLLNAYDQGGSFFVRIPVNEKTGELCLPPLAAAKGSLSPRIDEVAPEDAASVPELTTSAWAAEQLEPVKTEESGSEEETQSGKKNIPVMDLSPKSITRHESRHIKYRYEWRATMLVLVVVCLEITDLLFALDSVSAIIAQIPDLYLAFTACVFAMLGLRATFFVIDELIRMFSLLKYGVAAILIFIGVKLIVSKMIYIPPSVVCFILFGTLGLCVAIQVLFDHWKKEEKVVSSTAAVPSTAAVV